MTDENGTKLREFTRNAIELTAWVSREGEESIHGMTRRLSMNGMFLVTSTPLPEATRCQVYLTLPDGQTQVPLVARVVAVLDDGIAFAFEEMAPESFAHLKRLVLYHAEDLQQVSRELDSHLGFKSRLDDWTPGHWDDDDD